MAHKNPWYIITAEEIATIQVSLQDLHHDLQERHRNRIGGIIGILDEVVERRP